MDLVSNILEMRKTVLKFFLFEGIVFFPFDLRPSEHTKDKVATNFLGQGTHSYTSLAYLVDRLKVPVLSVSFYRLNKKQHVLEVYPEMEWQTHIDKKQALVQNTQYYNNRLEEMLLAYPEQWLWSYRRW